MFESEKVTRRSQSAAYLLGGREVLAVRQPQSCARECKPQYTGTQNVCVTMLRLGRMRKYATSRCDARPGNGRTRSRTDLAALTNKHRQTHQMIFFCVLVS